MIKTALTISLIVTQGTLLFAQEADDKESTLPKVEMLTLKVLVLDPDEHPVEGAIVKPRGLRTKLDRGSWWTWVERRDGPVPEVLTDSKGVAEVPYPKYTYEKMEVGELNLYVTHPDFVQFDSDRNVDDKSATINLERGFRIAATAIDAVSGEPINTDLYGFISVAASGNWKQKKSGILVSPTLKKQKCILRLAQFEQGKPTKFSDRIEVEPDDRSRVFLNNVKLALGTRVTGKLDESVPRPVTAGHVAALIDLDVDTQGRSGNTWRWHDKALINADGTFVFESLPKDEILQLIAVCDGWAASKTQKSDVLKYFAKELRALDFDRVLPQLTQTKDDTLDITLPMTQTKSLNIVVVDPDGNPLSNAKIWSCPNQYWFGGSNSMAGTAYRSRDFKLDLEKVKSDRKKNSSRYLVTTDENGEAVMNNLPDTGFPLPLGGEHSEYELPILFGERQVVARLTKKGYAKVTMKMQKKGTDAMDGKQKEAARNAEAQINNTAKGIRKTLEGLFE